MMQLCRISELLYAVVLWNDVRGTQDPQETGGSFMRYSLPSGHNLSTRTRQSISTSISKENYLPSYTLAATSRSARHIDPTRGDTKHSTSRYSIPTKKTKRYQTTSNPTTTRYSAPTRTTLEYNSPTKSIEKHSAPTRTALKYNILTKSTAKYSDPTRSTLQYSIPVNSTEKYSTVVKTILRNSTPTITAERNNVHTSIAARYNTPTTPTRSTGRYSYSTSSSNSLGEMPLLKKNKHKMTRHQIQENQESNTKLNQYKYLYKDRANQQHYRVSVYQATVKPVISGRRKKIKKWMRKQSNGKEQIGEKGKDEKNSGMFVNLTRYKAKVESKKVVKKSKKTENTDIGDDLENDKLKGVNRMGLIDPGKDTTKQKQPPLYHPQLPSRNKKLTPRKALSPRQGIYETRFLKTFRTYPVNRGGGPEQDPQKNLKPMLSRNTASPTDKGRRH